jgi:hypothetical protein
MVIQSIATTCVVVLACWLLIAVLVIIGNTTHPNFIAPTPVNLFDLFYIYFSKDSLNFLSIGVGFVDLWSGSSSMNTYGFGFRFLSLCLCISCFTSGCVV